MQPIVSDDVAAALADVDSGTGERHGRAGRSEPIRLDELVTAIPERKPRHKKSDHRRPARYFGTELNDQSSRPR